MLRKIAGIKVQEPCFLVLGNNILQSLFAVCVLLEAKNAVPKVGK